MQKKLIAITDMRACEGDFLARVDLLARAKVDAIILREKHLSEAEYKVLAKEVMKICQKHGVLCVLHHFYEAALSLGGKAFHCPFGLVHKLGELRARFEVLGASVHSIEELAAAQRYLRGEKLEGEKLDGGILDSTSADCGGGFAESSALESTRATPDAKSDSALRTRDFVESKSCFMSNHAQDSSLDYVIAGHIFDSTCKPGIPPKGLNLLAQIRQKTSANIYAIGGINAQNLAMLCDATGILPSQNLANPNALSQNQPNTKEAQRTQEARPTKKAQSSQTIHQAPLVQTVPKQDSTNAHMQAQTQAPLQAQTPPILPATNAPQTHSLANPASKLFDGICMRSSLMTCENPPSYIANCKKILNKQR
ncbi:hypothetical protein BKN38_02970 [Helicobacter sp. CLO-3]|uniref:thiamine phosphate synthase n=1 Tax=unclassified Helicobacter TaxID=2593540 RepID=UPI000804FA76|nr:MULTISPECIES: thiamine phosphate synthase [unclassified Helicobacter]OBV30091.1 hypothetical protein BA723_02675 [Helicobacter sp. CLO-3]OHU84433.1 hypothetical protein BKN38_02970 [Helicobacter sp. CLO-3]